MKRLKAIFLSIIMFLSVMQGFPAIQAEAAVPHPNEPIQFSAPAGFYTEPFNLSLSTDHQDVEIRYTLDGSDPTPLSARYTAPLPIRDRTGENLVLSKIPDIAGQHSWDFGIYNFQVPQDGSIFQGNLIKARLFTSGGTPASNVVIKSYFVNSAIYTKYQLPVLSISTPQENFFDYHNGIYVTGITGANFDQTGADWERPVHLEMFETDGTQVLSQGMGVRIHGGWSRHCPQKTLRFYARKDNLANGMEVLNGKSNITYDLFQGEAKKSDGTSLDTYKRFMLRNAGNDINSAFMRDAVTALLTQDYFNIETLSYRPVAAFLNGEFWGLYNMRERYDDEYLAHKYGGNKSNYAIFERNGRGWTELGEGVQADLDDYNQKSNYVRTLDMTRPESYEYVKGIVDEDSLIDYVIAETFVGNSDWPHNNQRFWRYTGVPDGNVYGHDGKYRWMLYDCDNALGRGEWNDAIWRAMSDNDMVFFYQLMQNQDFRDKFINRYMDCVNMYLTAARGREVINKIVGLVDTAMSEQRIRWNYTLSSNSWNNEVNSIREFISNRASLNGVINYSVRNYAKPNSKAETLTLKNDTQNGHINLNGADLKTGHPSVTDASAWSGYYFTGYEQEITAVPKEGYQFEKFEVKDSSGTKILTDQTITVPVVSGGVTVTAYYMLDEKESITFTDGGGFEMTGLSSDTLKVSASLYNAEKENIRMFAAVYDSKGELVAVDTDSGLASAEHRLNFDITLSLPENCDGHYKEEGYYANVFFWGGENLTPLRDKVVFGK